MKKNILVVILLACFTGLYSQGSTALPKGGKQLNFGVPGYIGMDFAIHDWVTLGGKASFELLSNNNTVRVGVIGDFHFNELFGIPDNWDVYAGPSVGWRFKTDDNKGTDGIDFGGQVGGRWFWSDKWGLNVEAAWGLDLGGGVGLTMRM